jgi:uncharacterized protein with HEPN domain
MLDAAREALSFVEGRSRADLDRNRMLTLSLIAEIQIVGEAANKISPELKESIASIPWSDVIGMRNRLIHAYADINLDILWDTVKRAIPPLIAELETLLARG